MKRKEQSNDSMDLFPELQRSGGRVAAKRASAGLGSSAPLPSTGVDCLVAERTRFNEDRTHRFTWFRHWGDPDDFALGICMNPSGAAEDVSDPTVDGMVQRARLIWKVGAYYQLNVMSIRGTKSEDLRKAKVLNLPENDEWIRRLAPLARFVVVGWGNPGHESGRGPAVEAILREVCEPSRVVCFGRNRNGSPVHPLYQKRDAELRPFFS